jgi:hypothetical protein
MRRAAALVLLFGAFGCQPASPPQDYGKDLTGIWLRNDGSYTNGVSKDGKTTFFEEFDDQSVYTAIEHSVTDHFETYTITNGRWNVYDSLFTIRYAYKYSFNVRPDKKASRDVLEYVVEPVIMELDGKVLTYDDPESGKMTFVKGTYPTGFDKKYLRPNRPYFELNPFTPRRP